ncbi:MAG TPA: hypothetical protein VH601_25085 [Bryobacteraceae bacterium]|jgi:hypothetical protein
MPDQLGTHAEPTIEEGESLPRLVLVFEGGHSGARTIVRLHGVPKAVAKEIDWRTLINFGAKLIEKATSGGGSSGPGGGSGPGGTGDGCYHVNATLPDGTTITTTICPPKTVAA